MGQLTPPASTTDFKLQFTRDFNYGAGIETVRDTDIQAALNQASAMFNPTLFDTQPIGIAPLITNEALMAYLNLSAHIMVTALQGVGGLGQKGRGVVSQGEGITSSKGVGGVSIGFSWPNVIADSPILFQLTKTTYGQAYLFALMPKLVGNVSAVGGETAC